MSINQLYIFFVFCLSLNSLSAQDAFQYQAVVRDSAGQVIPNQLINIQAEIIQIEDHLPAIYIEEHYIESNDYGVVNLKIGKGSVLEGDFETIDWSQKSFLQILMDLEGGNNYTIRSLSEILTVPKALYAEKAGQVSGTQFGLIVTDFGAKGDGITDDTEAFEQALDSAAIIGGRIFVPTGIYKISRMLVIQDGVSLVGEGTGSDPLQTPYNGSLLWYTGDEFAIKVAGHNSRLKDLVIRDKSKESAAGGVLVEAKNRLVESIHFEELLISGFTNGTGLKLSAKQGGGIYYCSFNHVRIRHGKVGIEIMQDNNSYINSNNWNYCQITGGGFKYGLYVDGGNNNNMNGLVIESYSSTHGHFYLKKGEIFSAQMRIEGIKQNERVPLVYFHKGTKNSILSGVYTGGLTLDRGNNYINMRSGRAIHYKNSSLNRFRNAIFFSPDKTSVSDWDITGNYSNLEILAPELSEKHNVLKLSIPAGEQIRLEPSVLARPVIKDLPLYDQVNFGFYVKTDAEDLAHTFTNSTNGWTRSTYHSGSGEWEFVGMNAVVNRNLQSRFALQINNTTGQEQDIYISIPTLNFGNQSPTLDEQPISSSGGQLYGLLTHAVASATIPSNGFLNLPLTANYFEMEGTSNIYRINPNIAARFPKGSVITLLFDQAGIGISNSGYLKLKAGYTSVANGSITLISSGNGTWREVNRND